jgi:dTDP-4-dehydrorhamnose 3,5-epimerase
VVEGRTVCFWSKFMIFRETALSGAYVVDLQRLEDERGFFARAWCGKEFEEHGLLRRVSQVNIGFSLKRGTIRGLHLQARPHAEAKLVRCTRGGIYDVIVDLRPDSVTFRQWVAVELTAENRRMLYVPEGFAQGYQTLTDDAEMYYQTTESYAPAAARGVRYDDPGFAIEWPLPVTVVSDADRNWPDFVAQPSQRS